jgi:hypothetical protein
VDRNPRRTGQLSTIPAATRLAASAATPAPRERAGPAAGITRVPEIPQWGDGDPTMMRPCRESTRRVNRKGVSQRQERGILAVRPPPGWCCDAMLDRIQALTEKPDVTRTPQAGLKGSNPDPKREEFP